MTDLNTIISSFSKEEQQQFVTYLEKKNKRSDTKNIQLFKLLANDTLSSNEICIKLYQSKKRDAYHALRKRLFDALIDFTANTSLKETDSERIQIIKHTIAAHAFLQQQHHKAAYKLLDKAQKLAEEHQLFSELNSIYHAKIQFAHTLPDLNLAELICDFKTNQKHYFLEEELNIVYAKIRHTLNAISYQSKALNFQTILETSLKEHNISIHGSLSFKSLYQLLTIASISAFITKDYLQIEKFVLNTYEKLNTKKNKEQQLFYHIQVVYMISNTLFRNKKFNESLSYLEIMRKEMLKKQKKYYTRFKLKYDLLYALNHNYSNNQEEAINSLCKAIKGKSNDTESLLDCRLSLIVCYFQKTDLKKAYSLLSKFYHTDKWYIEKAGKEWTIKKNLIEILLHLELEHFDLFESRLLSFRRNYSDFLKSINQHRVLQFLKLVELYYHNPQQVTSINFNNTVENSFEWVEAKREDIFVMSFYAWLKSKMDKEPVYEVTLKLILQAQNVSDL